MAGSAVATRLRRLTPGPTASAGLLALVAVQVLFTVVYVTSPAGGDVVAPVTYAVVILQPFVWIDVGLLAVLTTAPPPVTTSRRRAGALIAVGYFLLLGYVGGLFGPGMGTGAAGVNWLLPPGYSPRLFYDAGLLSITLAPYKVVGYGALAYLVYVTVLDAAGTALSGVVGLFSCISCTWPVIGTIAAGVFGSSSALATAAMNQAYPLSTLVFLSAVALLWWRPSFGGTASDD